jgi:glycosyltransferase involved in cell wall biosynthesis
MTQISVILPNYNHADWLPRALRAFLSQDLPPDEIIVVDDGSTDSSVSVIESFQREHKCIRLIRHQSNRGAAAALNTGLAAASGEFVYCAAADDFTFKSFFSNAVNALKRFPDAAYFCGQVVLVEGDRVIGFRPFLEPGPPETFVSAAAARRIVENVDNWAVGQSVVYRRQFLAQIGGFDEDLGSFCDGLVYRRLAFDKGFYYSDRLVATWQIRADSLSASSSQSQTESDRLITAVKGSIARSFPAPLNKDYPAVFERRLRFNMARMVLSLDTADIQAIAELAGMRGLERRIVSSLGPNSMPVRTAILLWLTLRLRPFGFSALVRALFNSLTKNRLRLATAKRLIQEAKG